MTIAIRRIHSSIRAVLDQPIWVVTLITLLAAALRLFNLGAKSFWLDESILYWISRGPFSEIVNYSITLHNAPPLYPLLLHIISGLSESEAIMRLVSCAAGIMAVPSMYALARRIMQREAA